MDGRGNEKQYDLSYIDTYCHTARDGTSPAALPYLTGFVCMHEALLDIKAD